MSPWVCALLVSVAGAIGGIVNALITDNGFILPQFRHEVWCPGFLSNILVGAFAAFASWSFYGSGVAIDLVNVSSREGLSLRFSALAGAFLVGVAGAKWITSEADKLLLKESIKVAGPKHLSSEECQKLVRGSARQILDRVDAA